MWIPETIYTKQAWYSFLKAFELLDLILSLRIVFNYNFSCPTHSCHPQDLRPFDFSGSGLIIPSIATFPWFEIIGYYLYQFWIHYWYCFIKQFMEILNCYKWRCCCTLWNFILEIFLKIMWEQSFSYSKIHTYKQIQTKLKLKSTN